MSDIEEEMKDQELIEMYNKIAEIKRASERKLCKLKDEILNRVSKSNGKLKTKAHTVTVTEYPIERTAKIEDIRADLGDEFVDANLPVLTSKTTGRRLKIEQNI